MNIYEILFFILTFHSLTDKLECKFQTDNVRINNHLYSQLPFLKIFKNYKNKK